MNLKTILLATATSVIVTTSIANATNVISKAKVHIVKPITVEETNSLSFGKVGIEPSTGISSITVSSAGVRAVGIGSASLLVGGTVSAGSYEIQGNTSASDTINIAITDTPTTAGLSLSNFTADYNGTPFTNSGSALDSPDGGTELLVGGTLTIDSALVADGNLEASYTIDVNYD